MVPSAVEPSRHKRKRKNSHDLNKRKQFNANFDGKVISKVSLSSKSETSKLNQVSNSFSSLNSNKNEHNNSHKTKPDDNGDDVTSLEDYADCSETEMEIMRHKGASITDAISAIMSEGGALGPNGSLLRPNFKKKTRNKRNKKKKIAKSTASENASNDKQPAYDLCSPTNNSKNVQQNHSFLGNKDANDVAKNYIDASFPNKLSSCQPTKVKSLNRKENLVCNALAIANSQTSSGWKNDKDNESISECKLQKGKKKLKISSQSSCSSLQVEDCANSKDAFNSSVLGNKTKMNSINPEYTNKSFKKMINGSWSGSVCDGDDLKGGTQVIQQPFNCVRLPQFIDSGDNLLGRLGEELSQLHMSEKNNDMYKFYQSVELPQSGACLELREMLEGPVLRWLRKTTGIPLNDKVALSASLYLHSDVLLCHDDELEGRRVAFILYLTGEEEGVDSSWDPQDGGSLDLFSCDESGRPQRVVQRLYPAHNTFAFFEVSPASFHQVSEVLSPHKVRLSVNGWFHGPGLEPNPRPLPVRRRFLRPGHVELEEIYSWISPLFRTESLQASVRKQFEKDSQIYLEDFVPEEKYAELCQALRDVPRDTWQWTGPPNRVHYQVAPSKSALPNAVQQLLRVLQSEAGLLVMAQLTGLPLHPLAPSDGSDDEDDDGDSEDGSEVNSSDCGESEEECNENQKKAKKCRTKSKKSCDGGTDREENSSDDEMMEQEEEKIKTLKALLKKHKKASKSLLRHSNAVQEESPKKKKRKRSRGPELDARGMDQAWVPDVGLGRDQKGMQQGDCSSSMGQVYSSVRRVGHGCYSLILDDDNDGDSGDVNSSSMATKSAAVDGDKKKKAVKSCVEITDAQKESFHEDAGKRKELCSDGGNTGKKNKKSSGKKEESSKALKGSCKFEMETKKDSSSSEGDKFVLDLVYFVDVPEDWQESWGGYTAYVAKGEREELLTVTPRPNTLALVYRDADTFSFLKHVNCRAAATNEAGEKDRHYHALVCQYK